MRMLWGPVKIAAVLSLAMIVGVASAQSGVKLFEPLVRLSAHRLLLAEQVALSKWDTHAEVEDVPREANVLLAAVKAGEKQGLDPTSTAKFFRAQIEANKLIQYSLLAGWRRGNEVPRHAPVDLSEVIRPELDRLQGELITELAATKERRHSEACSTDVTAAVGNYVASHRHEMTTSTEIALYRAMSETCTSRTVQSHQ